MFENIIAQNRVVEEIEKAVNGRSVPGALLFSGEHYTGKISTALELARVLNCSGDCSWNCPCRSCETHRLLLHPYLQMIGNSSFMDEINTCAEILKKSQPVYARYMFIRAVRKLLKRFDPVLWEGNEPKYKQAVGNAVKAEELLREIKVTDEAPEPAALIKIIDRIVSECGKIVDSGGADNIPISQIRRLITWAHTASDSAKIVIIENADTMGESARNSLLKLLEEPPQGCFFILTTSRKGAIIPTILSRVRVMNFHERTKTESAEVIKRIFRDDVHGFRNIREYFLSRKADIEMITRLASGYINCLTGRGESMLSDIGDFKTIVGSRRIFSLFIEECSAVLQEQFREGSIDKHEALALNEQLKKIKEQRELYNQSSQLLLESLLYRRAV